jgi:prepilin-type N-terminal cleavage/methylation domain-containing protein
VRRRGFTLVEVLVTLLIVSGIMLALTQLLEAARVSRDTIHNIQETQLTGPAIMDLIERDLRAIAVYDRPADTLLRVRQRVVLGHDADALDFATTNDSVVPVELGRRLVRFDYNEVGYVARVHPRDDSFLELYRREDYGIDEEPFDGGVYTFLSDRVKHFEIAVFEEDGQEAEPLEEWGEDEEHQGLPLRLEIRLTLELAPRVTHEQLTLVPLDKRTVTYTRIVRLPEDLRAALDFQPVPSIPVLEDPAQSAASGGTGSGDTGGSGAGGDAKR